MTPQDFLKAKGYTVSSIEHPQDRTLTNSEINLFELMEEYHKFKLKHDRVFKANLDIAEDNSASLANSWQKLEQYAADGEAQRLANLWNVTPIENTGRDKKGASIFDIKNHRFLNIPDNYIGTDIPSICQDADNGEDFTAGLLYQFTPDEQNRLTLEGRSGWVKITRLDDSTQEIYLNDGDSIDANSVKRMEWISETPPSFEHLTYGKHYAIKGIDTIEFYPSTSITEFIIVLREFDHLKKEITTLVEQKLREFSMVRRGQCFVAAYNGTVLIEKLEVMPLIKALQIDTADYHKEVLNSLVFENIIQF